MKLKIKTFIKSIFYLLGLTFLLDKLVYFSTKMKYRKANRNFRKEYPDFILPPDYFLYETYKLNYKLYFEDGKNTARELIDWVEKYLPAGDLKILDWGCGVSRICRHLKNFVQQNTQIFGCDINSEMIKWNRINVPEIEYSHIDYMPPTNYENDFFGFIYGISIFTHIENHNQEKWFNEICRILKKGGVFLFTTHGTNCFENLLPFEKKELEQFGSFTKLFGREGHRMMITYNTKKDIEKKLADKFTVIEIYDDKEAIAKTGAQDLWIVKKIK